MNKPLRIGIIGLGAERGWATAAHIPALHALSDDFELAGVANTSLASARAARIAYLSELAAQAQLNRTQISSLESQAQAMQAQAQAAAVREAGSP